MYQSMVSVPKYVLHLQTVGLGLDSKEMYHGPEVTSYVREFIPRQELHSVPDHVYTLKHECLLGGPGRPGLWPILHNSCRYQSWSRTNKEGRQSNYKGADIKSRPRPFHKGFIISICSTLS